MKHAILLLRNRSFFGANIVNLPAIHVVKKYLQADHISLFTDANVRYFYDQVPWVAQQSDAKGFLAIYRNIPKNVDFLYSMRPSMDSVSVLKPLKNIQTAVGFSLRSRLLNRWFDYHLPCNTSTYRGIAHIQALLSVLKLPDDPTCYLREAMLALLGPTPKAEPLARICVMPGAGGGEHKKWSIESYWQLITQIHQQYPGVHFDFVLGNDEDKEIEFLKTQKTSLSFSIQKNLKLKELIALVEGSVLTIANDCGPSHISQCLVKPFVGLYHQPNPEWFLGHSLSRSLSPADKNIKHLSVNDVLAASLDLLACQHQRSSAKKMLHRIRQDAGLIQVNHVSAIADPKPL